MAKKKSKKKKSKSSKKKTSSTEPSWDKIGQMIGKKIEKEVNMKDKTCFNKWEFKKEEHGGFVGRILFAVGMLLLLNVMNFWPGVNPWIKVLLVVGFALMKF